MELMQKHTLARCLRKFKCCHLCANLQSQVAIKYLTKIILLKINSIKAFVLSC